MNPSNCIACSQPLSINNTTGRLDLTCNKCGHEHQMLALCHTCNHPLERLQACGSVSYFCHQCNELKSKSTAIYQLQSLTQ